MTDQTANERHWPYVAPPITVEYEVVDKRSPASGNASMLSGLWFYLRLALIVGWLTAPIGFIAGLLHQNLGW